MNSLSKRQIFLRYLSNFLLPILVATLVTLVSVHYINDFVKLKNERVSETIVHHLSLDLESCISEAEQVVLAYATNRSFFIQLSSLLRTNQMSYQQLQTLRTLEENVNITHSIRPYIASIYLCPSSEVKDSFLVSQDGIYSLATHPDGQFIREACAGLHQKLQYRVLREDTPLKTEYLTCVGQSVTNIGNAKGTVIVNIECRAVQSMLESYVSARTDELFLVRDGQGRPLFGSEALVSAADRIEKGRVRIKLNDQETEYLETASLRDARGFTFSLFATHASLYASSESLIALNVLVMLLSIAVGVATISLFTARKYKDYVRVGDYMRKLDDIGSRAWKSDGYASKYEDVENYLRLHLSEHELKERTLELETLRHQLNPHLLMNTMQMLNWRLMRQQGGHTELNVTIENLCKILSYTLRPADSLVTLAEEMKYTEAYMALQNHNAKKPASIDWRIDREWAERIQVPRVIFQPLLENAFKHAFEGEQSSPLIWVTCKVGEDNLLFTVHDNGCGIDLRALERVRGGIVNPPISGKGIGLYNTNKRIQLLFGRHYGLAIESETGKGTAVTIKLPMMFTGGGE